MVHTGAERLYVLIQKEMFPQSVNCMDSVFFWCPNSESSLNLWKLHFSHSLFQSQYHVMGTRDSEKGPWHVPLRWLNSLSITA